MQSLKNFFYHNRLHLLFLFLGLMMCLKAIWHWFSGNSIIYFVDSYVPLDIHNSFLRIFNNFDVHRFPWNPEPYWGIIPYWVMISSIRSFFQSLSLAQASVYLILLFSAFAGFYFLANYIITITLGNTNNRVKNISSFTFALFYTFNLYSFYYAFFMFNPDAYIIAFLPLNILSLFKLYFIGEKKKNRRFLFLISFFVTLLLMSSGFSTYIFLAQYLFWVFLYLFLYFIFAKKTILKFFELVFFLIAIILSQWWWFFPALLGFTDLYEFQSKVGTTVWFLGGFEPAHLLNTFRLLGVHLMMGNLFSWSSYYIDNKLFTLPLFLLPFLLLYLLLNLKILKTKFIPLYLFVMFLVSLFIVKFSNPPAAFILGWAFEKIPYFGAFREFYHKAGMYYVFAYFLLGSIASAMIISRLLKVKNRIFLYIYFALLLVVGAVITGPYFLFSYDNIRTFDFTFENREYSIKSKTEIPAEYYQLKKMIEPLCRDKSVLVIPRGAWIASANWDSGKSYMGVDYFSQLINCTFIITIAQNSKAEASNQSIFLMLENDDLEGVKSFMYKNQIQYVLLRFDNIPHQINNWQYVNPIKWEKALSNDPDFEKKKINKYFTFFSLKSLEKIDFNGISLNTKATYTNSPLTRSTDYVSITKYIPNVLGPVIINTKENLSRFVSHINNFLIQGVCTSCNTKGEIDRLLIGSKKKLKMQLFIEKEGEYVCEAQVLVPGVTIRDIHISNGQNKIDISNSSQVTLLKGNMNVEISYTSPVFLSKKSVHVIPGEIIEFPLKGLLESNYKLSYVAHTFEMPIDIYVSRKKLSKKIIEQQEVSDPSILFHNPTNLSKETVKRILQFDPFNVQTDYLYIKGGEGISSTSSASISNLVVEKAIDTNYVSFTCYQATAGNTRDTTRNMLVSKINQLKYKIVLPKDFHSSFMTFNKTFVKDWVAYEIKPDGKRYFPHFQSGFANAWYIKNPKGREIYIEFERQERIIKNARLTIIAFCIVAILYIYIRNKNV